MKPQAPFKTGERVPTHISATEFVKRFDAQLRRSTALASAVERRRGTGGRLDARGAGEWTNALLNMVLELGRGQQYDVYPGRYLLNATTKRNSHYQDAGDVGEWMFDACWTQYPGNRRLVEHVRRVAARLEPLRDRYLCLACESEWGGKTPDRHVEAVLDDFAKLVECRAPLKVMIYGYYAEGPGSLEDLKTLLRTLAASDNSGSDYVLMGWENGATWDDRLVKRDCEVLSGPAVGAT